MASEIENVEGELLEASAKFQAARELGQSLMAAIEEGLHSEVERLLREGADPNFAGWDGARPLHEAAFHGDAKCLAALMNAGADLEARDRRQQTPLHRCDDCECAKLLIDAGARVDAIDEYGWTRLMHSANGGLDRMVGLLLAHGADANMSDRLGNTALIRAAIEGSAPCMEALLAAGADPGAECNGGLDDDFDGLDAAKWCAKRGFAEGLALLVGAKVRLDAPSAIGETAAMLAADIGSLSCLVILAAAGCDLEARDGMGRSAWDRASARDRVEGCRECAAYIAAKIEHAMLGSAAPEPRIERSSRLRV